MFRSCYKCPLPHMVSNRKKMKTRGKRSTLWNSTSYTTGHCTLKAVVTCTISSPSKACCRVGKELIRPLPQLYRQLMAAGEETFSSVMEPLARCPYCYSSPNESHAAIRAERGLEELVGERESIGQKVTKRAAWTWWQVNSVCTTRHSKTQCS